MLVQINAPSFDASPELNAHVRDQVEKATKRFSPRVTRVEVHLHDDNAHKKSATDKRCLLEARLTGMEPLTVEHAGEDLYKTVAEAAGKLERLIGHRLDRSQPRH
jgi:ribosomal subunit interface protein